MAKLIRYSLLVFIVTVIALVAIPAKKSAATVNYQWEYDVTNVYNTNSIRYSFDNLDTTQSYAWSLWTVDDTTGALKSRVGFRTSFGVASTTFLIGGAPLGCTPASPFPTPSPNATCDFLYPENYVGPLAVTDSNGTILGRHYLAQLPSYVNSPESEWFSGAGNTALNEKQVVGPGRFSGTCRNPAYGPINADGWQHSFEPCSVTTTSGDYALMHYQIDPTYTPGTNEKIRFYPIPTATLALTIDIDDIISYQVTGTYTGVGKQSYSFIVINTNGQPLPFIDNARADGAFVTDDNPMRASFDPGIYNYVRSDPSYISDGESVWIVTEDEEGFEWGIQAVGNVGEEGQQTVTTTAVTSAIWDAYHGAQEIEDVTAGYSNTTIYGFAESRKHTYTLPPGTGTDIEVTWTNEPIVINSPFVTPSDMRFIVSTTYDIIDVSTLEERINTVLGNTGLDTDSGRAAVLTLLLVGSMIVTTAMIGLRANMFVHLIVWTGVGSTFVLGGFGTLLVNTVYITLTIGLWVFAIAAAQSSTDESI